MTQAFVTHFALAGKLEDLAIKSDNCIKSLQLTTEQGNYWIKVAKEIRSNLSKQLQPGCLIKVTGMRKYEIHKEKVKYKAYKIELLNQPIPELSTLVPTSCAEKTKPKAKVLFCQKSTCWKQGGKTACQLLKTELENRGIAEQVEIKTVGCLKQCKKAPNMVIMPDKAHYSYVEPQQLPRLIEKHLSC